MTNTKWILQELPIDFELENKKVLKKLPAAHAALAELKGVASSIPNQQILINTLGLQEAKDSSAIENIVTTHDDLYKSSLNLKSIKSLNAKEVQNYVKALKSGYELVKENQILSNKTILTIQETLEGNNAGFRKVPGTTLKNEQSGEIIYTPPQDANRIIELMSNLEEFINNPEMADYDVVVKMAVIHFQFESVHPFYDGNGRTGRIINILYLVMSGLQNLPILYLSSFIIRHKSDYYRLLQKVREENDWESWLLFMIEAVQITARETIRLVSDIKLLMKDYKQQLKANYKFYSQDLLENLFKHPYTKIDFLMEDLGVTRLTASNYLKTLSDDGFLQKEKLGRVNYYINIPLFELLSRR
jgi:Fic family protein